MQLICRDRMAQMEVVIYSRSRLVLLSVLIPLAEVKVGGRGGRREVSIS